VSCDRKTIVVVHTDEGDDVKIISARLAAKREKEDYQEGI